MLHEHHRKSNKQTMTTSQRSPLLPEHRSAKFRAIIKIITPTKGNIAEQRAKQREQARAKRAYKVARRIEKASKRLEFMENRYDDFASEEEDEA